MAKFKIEITETLQKQYIVEATTKEEALDKMRTAYNNGEIELDYNNFVDEKITYIQGLAGEEYIEKFVFEEE
jgi:hypothetical protein